MSDVVIQLDGVRKEFGDFVAVEQANFSIDQGEFFAMLGPSGCGKTTTLKMIAGFEQPTSGRVLLNGEDVSRVPPYKRNVNTVFQQYALFPHMSVIDNVRFGPKAKKLSKKRLRGERHADARRRATVRLRQPQALAALRWAATTRRARPCPGQLPRARCSSTNRSPPSTSSCVRRCSSS